MENKKGLWIAVGALVLLATGIFFIWWRAKNSQTADNTNQSASTTTTTIGNVTITGPNGATITEVSSTPVPASTAIPAPDLNHIVNYSADLSPDVVATLKTQIATWTAMLKKDPTNGEVWLQLAVDYKIVGDYPAAENVWIYMTRVSPSSPVAFEDLGDLYQNFLKEYPKAEVNYLSALKLDPKNISIYSDLFTLYHYQYKTNTTAAAGILMQGLKANPNNPDLLALQAQLQAGK